MLDGEIPGSSQPSRPLLGVRVPDHPLVTTDMRDIGKAFGVTTHALPPLQRLMIGSISGAPHQ